MLQEIQIGFGFTFLVPAQNSESHKTVVVVVDIIMVVTSSLILVQMGASYCVEHHYMSVHKHISFANVYFTCFLILRNNNDTQLLMCMVAACKI